MSHANHPQGSCHVCLYQGVCGVNPQKPILSQCWHTQRLVRHLMCFTFWHCVSYLPFFAIISFCILGQHMQGTCQCSVWGGDTRRDIESPALFICRTKALVRREGSQGFGCRRCVAVLLCSDSLRGSVPHRFGPEKGFLATSDAGRFATQAGVQRPRCPGSSSWGRTGSAMGTGIASSPAPPRWPGMGRSRRMGIPASIVMVLLVSFLS